MRFESVKNKNKQQPKKIAGSCDKVFAVSVFVEKSGGVAPSASIIVGPENICSNFDYTKLDFTYTVNVVHAQFAWNPQWNPHFKPTLTFIACVFFVRLLFFFSPVVVAHRSLFGLHRGDSTLHSIRWNTNFEA